MAARTCSHSQLPIRATAWSASGSSPAKAWKTCGISSQISRVTSTPAVERAGTGSRRLAGQREIGPRRHGHSRGGQRIARTPQRNQCCQRELSAC
jgi:hypothetical protein